MGEGLRSIISELRRRKVTGVVVAYAIVGAGVIGVVADGGPSIGMPPELIRIVIWCVIGGFPIAVLLSWFFRVGPEAPRPRFPQETPTPQETPDEILPPSFKPVFPKKGLYIQTLGGIRIFRDGKEITDLPRKPIRCALLAYVAVEKNPPKEKALALLWPEKDPELARKSLNQTLTELRKDLGDDWVDSKGQFLVLREDIGTDLSTYQHAINRAEWETALIHYEGRFLEGFYLPGAYDFGEWQEQISGRVSLSQRKANTRLIEEKHKEGDFATALGLAKEWSDRAPLDDGAQNWFIRLLAETGQRGAALKHAEAFLARLEREEEEPLEETVDLIERIKIGSQGVVTGEVPSSPPQMPAEERPLAPTERILTAARLHFRKLAFAGSVILISWLLFGPRGPRTNPNRVVCLPPAIAGTFRVQSQDVCTALSMALERIGPLALLDGRPFLDPTQVTNGAPVTVAEARSLAIELQAGFFVLPTVMAEGDSLYVTLQLFETESREWVRQSSGVGDLQRSSSGQIAARAALELLPHLLDPGREVDLDFITDRDPAAVALWIEGERHYRELRFDSAETLLRAAVDTDSLLAQAALKGAQAASWIHHRAEADSLSSHALRLIDLLSPREALFTKGLGAYYRGNADSAVLFYKEALEIDPEWNEGWIGLGEVYYHLLPSGVTSPDDAKAAFREALRLDPSFLTPLIHLGEIAIREGDTARAKLLTERIGGSGVDLETAHILEYALDCITKNSVTWADRIREDPTATLLAGKDLAVSGAAPGCASGAFREILLQEPVGEGGRDLLFGAVMGLTSLLIAGGEAEAARTVHRTWYEAGMGSLPYVFLTQATVAPELDPLAEELWQLVPDLFGEDLERIRVREGWSLLGWRTAKGDSLGIGRLSQALIRAATTPPHTGLKDRIAHVARGHLALSRGDTAAAIEAFSSMQFEMPNPELTWGLEEVLPYERLLLAELLLDIGEYARAYQAAEVFDHPGPMIFVSFLPRSLVVRMLASEAMGWRDRAGDYRLRLQLLGRSDLIDEG